MSFFRKEAHFGDVLVILNSLIDLFSDPGVRLKTLRGKYGEIKRQFKEHQAKIETSKKCIAVLTAQDATVTKELVSYRGVLDHIQVQESRGKNNLLGLFYQQRKGTLIEAIKMFLGPVSDRLCCISTGSLSMLSRHRPLQFINLVSLNFSRELIEIKYYHQPLLLLMCTKCLLLLLEADW